MGKKKMLMRKFGSIAIVNNTFIGGVASVINTPSLLAAKLKYYPSGSAFSENDIQNFTIVGDDIECCINIDYSILTSAFLSNTDITYYLDNDSRCLGLNNSSFNQAINLYKIKLEGVLNIGRASFESTLIQEALFPKCLELSGNNTHFALCDNLEVVYLPECLTYGPSVGYDNVFALSKQDLKVYAHPSMETINSGGVEGDLLYVTDKLNGSVSYVTDTVNKPNQIIDLAVNTVYKTAIKLDWSIPSSTNTIDYYEIYVDGTLFNDKFTINEAIITSLTNLQIYTFTVIAVDIFYNKSEISNIITQQINGVGYPWQSNILSYYQFENNVLDSIGGNDGVATDITYASGQVGNAAVFNGSTSKIQLPDTILSTPEFSIVFLVKLNTTSGEQRVISFSDNLSGAYTSIRLNIGGVANRIGVMVYDGPDSRPKTVDGYDLTEWHSIILTAKSNDNYKLYVDGILEIEDNNFGDFATVAGSNYFGSIRNGTSNFIEGLMDDTAFLNKILSPTEVTEIDTLLTAGFPLI